MLRLATSPVSRLDRLERPATGASGPRAAGGADPAATIMSRLQQSDFFHEYQQAFETATGLPLVLREAGSFRTPLQGSSRVNPFCALMTQANKTCAACLQLQQRLEEEATQGPKTLQCYAGLSETAVPVRLGGRLLGYLQTGQVFLQAPTQQRFHRIPGVNRDPAAGPDAPVLESAYFQTRVIAAEQYKSIIRLLAVFAQHLATVSNEMLIRTETAEPAVITKVRAFIAAHHGEAMGLHATARAMNISAFYFCKVFKKSTGFTFTEYLARERTEAVKQMLLDANMRVSEAAFAAGFQSLSQFNRVFRRVAGEAPSAFRDRLRGGREKSRGPAGVMSNVGA